MDFFLQVVNMGTVTVGADTIQDGTVGAIQEHVVIHVVIINVNLINLQIRFL